MLHPTMPILLKVKRLGSINRIRTFYRRSPFQFYLLLFMGLFLSLILFFFFYGGFSFLGRFSDLKDIVVKYIFSLFFFAIFLMLTVSGTIISYSILYRSRQAEFLLTSPVPHNSVFFISFVDSVMFSSWAFMFLAVPILLAYGISFKMGFWFFPLSFLALFPFLLIPASIAGGLVLLISLLPKQGRKPVMVTLVLLVLIPLIYSGVRVFMAERRYGIMESMWIEEVFRSLNFARNPFLPSLWASEIVTSFSVESWDMLLLYFLLLLSTGLFFSFVAHLFAIPLYFRAWNVVMNFGSGKKYGRSRLIRKVVNAIPLLSPEVRIILRKDIQTFFRDPAQWSQFLLFFGIIGIYFLNLRSFAYDDADLRWKSMISFLNLAAVCMTLATLNSRFVFPQISLEGTKFWVLGLMPVTRREIVRGKFYFAFLSGWIISTGLVLLSDFMLRISWNIRLFHAFTVFLVSFGLAGLSVGSGTIWPNFKETVPSKIVSGLGGTLNLIMSVFFVAVIIFIEAVPCHYYIIKLNGKLFPSVTVMGIVLFFAAFTAMGSGLLFMKIGTNRFNRVEVF